MNTCKNAILAIALLAGTAVHAQQPPAPGNAPQVPAAEQGLRVRGLAFQLAKAPGEIYAHDPSAPSGTPGVKLDLKGYLNHEFNLLPFRGKNLVCTASADPASVKDSSSLLAKVTLPDKFKGGIFMFLPGTGAAGSPAYRVLAIDDSLSAFPRGSFKVINLSPATVRIQLEKEIFQFKSGEMKLIEDPPLDENNNSGMRAFSQVGNQWQKIGSGIWPGPGQKRVLQVLFENPSTKQIELKGIRDVAVRDN